MRKIFFISMMFVLIGLMFCMTANAEERLMKYDTTAAKYVADSEMIADSDSLTISKNCTVTLISSTSGYYVGAIEVIDGSGNVNIARIPNGEDLYIIDTDDISDISSQLSESGGVVYYKGEEIGTGSWLTAGDNTSTGSLNLGGDLTVQGTGYVDEIKSYTGGSNPTVFTNANGFEFVGDSTFTGNASISNELTIGDLFITSLYYLDFAHANDGELRRNNVTQMTIEATGIDIANNLTADEVLSVEDIYLPLSFDTSVSGSYMWTNYFPVKDAEIEEMRVVLDLPISDELTISVAKNGVEFSASDRVWANATRKGAWVTGVGTQIDEDDTLDVSLYSGNVNDLSTSGYLHIRARGRDRT